MTDILASHHNQFARKCNRLGMGNPGLQFFSNFLEDSRRSYHGATHIASLRKIHSELYKLTGMTEKETILVDLVIFWHDLIYDPIKTDNEWASAQFFRYYAESEVLKRQIRSVPVISSDYLSFIEIDDVYSTILSTNHAKVPHMRLNWGLYMLDLDLAGIGADWDTFNTNTENIKKEYMAFGIKESAFVKGRIKFWKWLKERGPIYHNPYNLDYFKYAEVQASKNIDKELALLEEELTEFNH